MIAGLNVNTTKQKQHGKAKWSIYKYNVALLINTGTLLQYCNITILYCFVHP